MRFTIIIPTHGKVDMLVNCIRSIRKHESSCDYEIIVIDDFSTKLNRERLIELSQILGFRLFGTQENVGFSKAVNIGLSASVGKHIVICNNDVLFTEPVLNKFETVAHNCKNPAVIGCKLSYPDGSVQHGGVAFVHNSFIHTNDSANTVTSRYAIAVTFALCMITREFYQRFGGLNESFFMACEDSEYCIRAWRNGYSVFYSSQISAIHLEGATRGRSDQEKKKNIKWFQEEKNSIALLKQHLHDINTLLPKVDQMNGKPGGKLKIEIGAGHNPQPGYEHIDARALPHIEHVLDFSKDRLPYGDESVYEVLSNHSIEHVSYRSLPFVIGEWYRVLKMGGRVILRTPDLEFICQNYLKKKTTPEWPSDEKYIKENLGRLSPGWWANIKLYAGQDYPGNFHLHCFDFQMIDELFRKMGFRQVRRINVTPVFSPGELQIEAIK